MSTRHQNTTRAVTIVLSVITFIIPMSAPAKAAQSGGSDTDNAAAVATAKQNSQDKFSMCENISDGGSKSACESCVGDSYDSVWTALGCIPTDPKAFVVQFLRIASGIAGGVALLLMTYGAFLVSSSAGDPKKADEGKEVITGAIAGLLFIIFSAFLLKLIGVDILRIPGIS